MPSLIDNDSGIVDDKWFKRLVISFVPLNAFGEESHL